MLTNTPLSLLDRWIQENDAIVNKSKQLDGGDAISRDHDLTSLTLLKQCHVESHKLLQKIQGVSAVADHVQLELTVVYNSCVFSLSQTQLSEAEQTLAQGLERVLGVVGCKPPADADPPLFWQNVLKCVESSAVRSSLLQLLCLNWALWLSTCRLGTIRDLQEELISLSEGLGGAGAGGEKGSAGSGSSSENSTPRRPLLVLDPRELRDLLQICTVIAQGAEWLGEGRCSEALGVLQRGPSMPAPRALLAHTHFLSGVCFTRMDRPQSALQCFRQAMEVDPRCVCALHQGTLVYRKLGNTQAEIEALSLLHSMLMLPPTAECGTLLLHPDCLLHGQSLRSLLSVPSPLSVLHSLALKCVLHGRVSEGVEHYLDLLADLQSDNQHTAYVIEGPPLPRLPELYLEAGSALLAARRPADCLALCDEVISTTLELLPEKLILEEESLEGSEAGPGSPEGLGSAHGRLSTVLCAGAAHLLQAHCHAHLKDWKQAVTHYTRSINLVVKVCIKQKGRQPQAQGEGVAVVGQRLSVCALQRLKGLALAGRGISFAQRDQLREALRDLQLSLQASPGCMGAGLWLGEVLWRLGRRQEAAGCWEKAWSSSREPASEGLPLYLQDPQTGPSLDPEDLRRRVEDFTRSAPEGSPQVQK